MSVDSLTKSLKNLSINISYPVIRFGNNENDNKNNNEKYKYICGILKILPSRHNKLLYTLGLSRNDVDIIRQGESNPLYDYKIEKLYNLFNACSDRKRHLIHKYVKKIIRQ